MHHSWPLKKGATLVKNYDDRSLLLNSAIRAILNYHLNSQKSVISNLFSPNPK